MAGMGMTGYDAAMLADEHIPRGRVDFNTPYDRNDAVIERRMDERLLIKGYPGLQPYSFGGHVYLVGEVLNREDGTRAIRIAQSVSGIKSLTTHFFPASEPCDPAADQRLTATLTKRFRSDALLGKTPVRLTVVHSKAILMGPAPDARTKQIALDAARSTPGIIRTVDYIVVAR